MSKKLTDDGWDILHEPYNCVQRNLDGGVKHYHNQIDARIELLQYFDEGVEATERDNEKKRIFNLTFHTVEEPISALIKRRLNR